MFKKREFEQIDWHLTEIEFGRQIELNVGSIRNILKSVDFNEE